MNQYLFRIADMRWRFKMLILLAVVFFLFMPSKGNGKIHNWNEGRSYQPFSYATNKGIEIKNTTDSLQYSYLFLEKPEDELRLRFRSKNFHGNPSKKYRYLARDGKEATISNPHWGFFIIGENDTVVVTLKCEEGFTQVDSKGCLTLTLYDFKNKIKRESIIRDGINPYQGENLWEIGINRHGINIKGGDNKILPLFSYNEGLKTTGFGFICGWGGRVRISDISLEIPDEVHSSTVCNIEELIEFLSESEDELEGFWTIYDRDLDESLLKLGGDYMLACVKVGEEYYFLYLEGGNVNSRNWKPGELKIKMSPTKFKDLYDIEWYDSMKELLKKEIRAQRGEGDTLLIQFPYQSSSVRLRRLPKN